MANPKGGRKFKPGQSGNPAGRPPVPQEVKVIRQITRDDLIDLGLMVVKGDVPTLQLIVDGVNMPDPDPMKRPTPLQALVATSLLRAIKKGDASVLNALLDRFFGKTPISVFIGGAGKGRQYTPEEAQIEARRLLAEVAADD